jgi:hypothetical protein
MKNGYFSLWENCIAGILSKVNDLNVDLNTPGTRYEIIQILRQPTDLDTPGGCVTEGWIGIVLMTTPVGSLPPPPTIPDEHPF